jgi:mitochondrial fission protein ELM1
MGYLALADALVVTGESASMLAEACATGKPVYIYPLSERSPGPRTWALRAERWLADLVTARAYAQPVNRRRRERPQRGLELWCAMLLAHGFVRTRGHSRRLHETLVERGLARFFDGKLAPIPSDHLTDIALVARRVRELMGVPERAPRARTL